MKSIDFFSAKKKLTVLWIFIASLLFAFFSIQFAGTRYDGIYQEACGWFLPNVIPIISLVITGFFGDMWKAKLEVKIDRVYLFVAIYLSIAYCLLILFVMFAFTKEKGNIIDYYNNWNVLLGPVQGLTSASIGAFYLKAKQKNSETK